MREKKVAASKEKLGNRKGDEKPEKEVMPIRKSGMVSPKLIPRIKET